MINYAAAVSHEAEVDEPSEESDDSSFEWVDEDEVSKQEKPPPAQKPPAQARPPAGRGRGVRDRPPTPHAGRAPTRGRGKSVQPSGLGRGSSTNANRPNPNAAPPKSANRVGNLLAMFEAPK